MDEQRSVNPAEEVKAEATKPTEKKPSNKGKKIAYDVILGVLILIFGCSAFMLIRYYGQTASSKNAVEDLADSYVQYDPVTSEESPAEETPQAKGYSHAAIPSAVDVLALKAQNPDAVGWLFNQNGVINYPVMQGQDNDYYLDHLISGKKNVNGSLFLSYMNRPDFTDPVSLIFGHSMKNGTMFATLLRYRNQDYYEAYPDFYLYTVSGQYRAAVVAAYECKKDDRIYQTVLDAETKQQLVTYVTSRSAIRTGATVERDERLLALSTCSYSSDDARFVVVCKLIPLSGQVLDPLPSSLSNGPDEAVGNTSEQVSAKQQADTPAASQPETTVSQ